MGRYVDPIFAVDVPGERCTDLAEQGFYLGRFSLHLQAHRSVVLVPNPPRDGPALRDGMRCGPEPDSLHPSLILNPRSDHSQQW